MATRPIKTPGAANTAAKAPVIPANTTTVQAASAPAAQAATTTASDASRVGSL